MLSSQLAMAKADEGLAISDGAVWQTITTGPTRWGKDPLPVHVLLDEMTAQRELLGRRVIRRLTTVAQLARHTALVEERIRLLTQIPLRATHLAESAPADLLVGSWTVWTVQSWLYYSLIPKLAATGTLRVPVGRSRNVKVLAARMDESVVDAASQLCAVRFSTDAADPVTGKTMLEVHSATGYVRRFLCPEADGAAAEPAVAKGRHLEVVP